MNELEQKIEYTLRQYKKVGFGISPTFVDFSVNNRLMNSIITTHELNDTELGRLLNVFIEKYNKGNSATFLDSTERQMNMLIGENKQHIKRIENTLSRKMGISSFEMNYENKCYYLMYHPEQSTDWAQETFHISETYSPLMCLKMAYQMGEASGNEYKILLSDHATEVDGSLLAFASSEAE